MRCLILFVMLLVPLATFGQYNYASPVFVKSDASPEFLVHGDFNGDGKSDLAYWLQSRNFGNTAGKKLILILNHGNNDYEKVVIVSKTEDILTDLQAADLNGDGKDDLVGINYVFGGSDSHFVTFISEGDHFNETIATVPGDYGSSGLLVTDFDDDGDPDVMVSSRFDSLSFYENDGGGEFTRHVLEGLDGMWQAFYYVDVDGDGKKDFITATDDKLKVFLKSNDGYALVERPLTSGTADMTTSDFNGDGMPDVAISNFLTTSSIDVYYNTGDLAFTDSVNLVTGVGPLIVDHADYDHDGREDLVATTLQLPTVVAFHNTVSGFEFAGPTTGRSGFSGAITMTDLDGDGMDEMIIVLTADIMIYKNSGGSFALDFDFPLTFRSSRGDVTDLNNDGYADLVTTDGTTGAIGINYGKGGIQFEEKLLKVTGIGTYARPLIGDFNEDSFKDIIYYETSKPVIFFGGQNGFGEGQVISNGDPTFVFAPADYNQDGHLDYATGISLMLGDGTGQFTKVMFATFPDGIFPMSSLHLNNDNLPDLLALSNGKIYGAVNTGTSPYFTTFTQIIETSGVLSFGSPAFNIGALNNDNLSDFVSMSGSFRDKFFYNVSNGDGTFTSTPITLPTGASFTCMPRVVDVNNDGISEIIAPYTDQPNSVGVYVYGKDENGTYVKKADIHTGLETGADVAAADLNRDQKTEIILFKGASYVAIAIFPPLEPPTIASSNLQATNVTKTEATLTLTKGNGSNRIIIVRKKTTAPLIPVDNNFYETDGSHLIFSGDIEGALLANLEEGTTYVASVYEYNISWDTTSVQYLVSGVPQVEFTTATDPKKQQQITFTSPGDHLVGSAPFTLTASTTSGLPLEFTATTTNISIASGVLSFVSPGPATIKVSQAGNSEYLSAEGEVTFCVNPLIPTITYTESPMTLTSSSDTHNQWLLNDVAIPNATNKNYSPAVSGNYEVTVDYSGCSSTSEVTAISITGLEDDDRAINIYPNPATTVLMIESDQLVSNQISFIDILGRRYQLTAQGTRQLTIDVNRLSRGQYVLEMQATFGNVRKRVILE